MPKIVIQVDKIRSIILGLEKHQRKLIDEVCSYKIKGAFFMNIPGSDGKVHLLTKKRNSFPTGLLKYVTDELDLIKAEYKVVDLRQVPEVDTQDVIKKMKEFGLAFRPYHIDGFIKGIKNPYGTFWWCVAAGKTVLFSSLIKAFDKKTLVLTHRKELLHQLSEQIQETTDMEVGKIGDGYKDPAQVTVAITNSINPKNVVAKKFLKEIEYLIIDECHHSGASTWKKIAYACDNTLIRHGFSGTVFRTDNKDLLLAATTGHVIHRIRTSDLIRQGWCANLRIFINERNEETNAKGWAGVYKDLIEENKKRNRFACEFITDRYNDGKQVIVFVSKIKHGKIIEEMLIHKFGVGVSDVMFMSGQENMIKRKRALDKFSSGEVNILIGTKIYEEGIDIPVIDAGVNLAAGDSDISTIQRYGRLGRKRRKNGAIDVDTDEEVIKDYLDFNDMGHKYTRKHSRHRIACYNEEEAFLREEI